MSGKFEYDDVGAIYFDILIFLYGLSLFIERFIFLISFNGTTQ